MRKLWSAALIAFFSFLPARADSTWVYAVQMHAAVETQRIQLYWQADPYGATSYTVFKKRKEDTNWGKPLVTLPGSATDFVDTNVSAGNAYEYQVIKEATLGYKGFGYIFVGVQAPATEDRGRLVLVAEQTAAVQLEPEIEQLRQDLRGDGWDLAELRVTRDQSPVTVRDAIRSVYAQAPSRVNTVYLLGHVPVPRSGNLDWDTHGPRSQPADAYYGDMAGEWSLAPDTSPSYMPSHIELRVGRVDFANMPGLGAKVPWPDEISLLRQYLKKAHRWRHKEVSVPRRALMGNLRGDEMGGAPAASGYRVFNAFVGPGNVHESDVSWDPPVNRRWISILGSEPYLWAWGGGGGSPDGCGGLGTNIVAGVPGYLYSRDVVAVDAKAVFVMLFGSWFGQWDLTDNFIRSFLATPSLGLASMLVGRPHWFTHHMAMGEPIGYSAWLTMNNSNLYQNQSNGFPQAVYIALMGDPALRMEPVAPPKGLQATTSNGQIHLSWQASADPVAGYHVYRTTGTTQPFTRVTQSMVNGTGFADGGAPAGTSVYMVRSVMLQQNPSGSYWNLSQGQFVTATRQDLPPPAVHLDAALAQGRLRLAWNSQEGSVYHVQAFDDTSGWFDVSAEIRAAGTTLEWIEAAPLASTRRLYRVRVVR